LSLFKKRRRLPPGATKRHKKTKVAPKRSLAKEFKKKRTGSLKYLLSKTWFSLSKFWQKVAAILLVLIIVGFIVLLLFFSALFSVQHIKIDTNREISGLTRSQVDPHLQNFFDQKLFLISQEQVAKQIKTNLISAERISITKEYPDTLKINVRGYPISARWQLITPKNPDEEIPAEPLDTEPETTTNEEQDKPNEEIVSVNPPAEYLVNKVGIIIGSVELEIHDQVFLIEEAQTFPGDFFEGLQIIDPSDLDAIHRGRFLLEELTGRKIDKAVFLRAAQEVHFVDEFGVYYWTDLFSDTEEQISKLKYLIAETEILDNNPQYIDLRIDQKVPYKP
jgi:cell division septal protein FtsQ